MDGMMKVAVMNGIGEMGYTERPIPQAKDDEVVVKLEYVSAAAICTITRWEGSGITLWNLRLFSDMSREEL